MGYTVGIIPQKCRFPKVFLLYIHGPPLHEGRPRAWECSQASRGGNFCPRAGCQACLGRLPQLTFLLSCALRQYWFNQPAGHPHYHLIGCVIAIIVYDFIFSTPFKLLYWFIGEVWCGADMREGWLADRNWHVGQKEGSGQFGFWSLAIKPNFLPWVGELCDPRWGWAMPSSGSQLSSVRSKPQTTLQCWQGFNHPYMECGKSKGKPKDVGVQSLWKPDIIWVGAVSTVHGAPYRLGERHSTVLWWQEHNICVKRHHRESVERTQGVLYVDPPHPQRLCEGPRLC